MKQVLAFDFGASSGRAILGKLKDGRIEFEEIHRFPNDPVALNGTLYWDVLRLFFEIKQGLLKAQSCGGFDSVAIDTWGVDFGLLDKQGKLLENPVHYRDTRVNGMIEESLTYIDKYEFFQETGNQFIEINTVYQLLSLVKNRKHLLERADKLLFMPDLFQYFLTGKKASEYSIASTSQLLNCQTRSWSEKVMDTLGIPRHIFCDVIENGTVLGELSHQLCSELSLPKANVITVASHDTASALVAVPTEETDFLFLSCGTWSLMGTELTSPILTKEVMEKGLTNEGGYGNTIKFLKNIIGLWLIQESRNHWHRQGNVYSFSEIDELAQSCQGGRCYIDVDSPEFGLPGDIPSRVVEYCRKTGQYIPQAHGEIARCIYDSLAQKYAQTKGEIERITGKQYKVLHVIGGGAKSKLLCALTEQYCQCTVLPGPTEATALGNIATQLIATNQIKDIKTARQIIKNSMNVGGVLCVTPK